MTKRRDLTGKKFGQLTVREPVEDRLGLLRGWRCMCTCGRETVVKPNNLVQRKTRSCGCLARHNGALAIGVAAQNMAIWQYRKSAKVKGRAWRLSRAQAVELLSSPCFYCGATPSRVVGQRGCRGAFVCNGIDRVDNAQGYVPGNVVACCAVCNTMKGRLTQLQFIKHAQLITEKMAP